ncbi:hypothetical protein HJ590_11315 [Naumannella sp. ID2617S]|nr:hypothetical protein [Naumannella sp. ID2617S]
MFFLVGGEKAPRFVALDDALAAMREHHVMQREVVAEKLRGIDWLLSEIDAERERA